MKGRGIQYSTEEFAWLYDNRLMVLGEYREAFCLRFNRQDVEKMHLAALRKRNGWSTGRTGRLEKGNVPANKGKKMPPGVGGRHPNAQRTQFKAGQMPKNTTYLGHERMTKDGYIEISVAERNPYTGADRRYVQKHRWLWEQLHGPVPEGMALKCLGERTNTEPSNWEMVPRALLPRLSGRFGRGYDEAPAELKPTIMAVAKLEHGVRARRKAAGPTSSP